MRGCSTSDSDDKYRSANIILRFFQFKSCDFKSICMMTDVNRWKAPQSRMSL